MIENDLGQKGQTHELGFVDGLVHWEHARSVLFPIGCEMCTRAFHAEGFSSWS